MWQDGSDIHGFDDDIDFDNDVDKDFDDKFDYDFDDYIEEDFNEKFDDEFGLIWLGMALIFLDLTK